MTRFFIFLISILYSQITFSQLEFTSQKKMLFVGSAFIDGKKIISGVYITPIDKNNLNLQIDIMNNWEKKDSLNINVKIDLSSIYSNTYFTSEHHLKKPAYRYYNENGLEIFIAKEKWHDDSYEANGKKREKFYTISIVEIILPKNKKFYVKELPTMFNK